MLVSTLLERINYALRGTDDVAPTIGTDEGDYWLSVANQKKDEWATDEKNSWRSLWEDRTITGTIASADNTYNLPDDFIRPSDRVVVTYSGKTYEFEITQPEFRNDNTDKVYISGLNPQVLNFNGQVTATSPYIGGTIKVAGYYLPADMTTDSDDVPVDDPDWLAYAVASELAFNDTSYEDKAPDILAKANSLYKSMAAANRKGTFSNPRTIPTSVSRIRGF